MILSFALIILFGLFSGCVFSKIRMPPLFGMIITGIVIGPYVLNWIDASVLAISADIRKIALIIILIRAGLSLNIKDMKKVGRPAILLCFVPACFEIMGMIMLAAKMLGISRLDAAIAGTVAAAVSPAVIVPRMIKIIDEGYGTKKSIPQMILAGASVDDVFVIVMFSVFTGFAQGEKISFNSFVNIPFSIITGIAVGIVSGIILSIIFGKFKIRSTVQTIVFLSTCMLLTAAENCLPKYIPFASLIAVMTTGIILRKNKPDTAVEMTRTFNKMWIPAEIFLFVLVGASVDINYAVKAGFTVVALIIFVLVFRIAGVFLCLIKTELSLKEKLFCMLSYTPKATVQAAIGGIPLAMGLECGNIVLTIAVTAILITAPIGAFAIDLTYKKFLSK